MDAALGLTIGNRYSIIALVLFPTCVAAAAAILLTSLSYFLMEVRRVPSQSTADPSQVPGNFFFKKSGVSPAVYIGASVLAFGAVTMIQAASTNWQTLMGLCVRTSARALSDPLEAHLARRYRGLGASEPSLASLMPVSSSRRACSSSRRGTLGTSSLSASRPSTSAVCSSAAVCFRQAFISAGLVADAAAPRVRIWGQQRRLARGVAMHLPLGAPPSLLPR